VMVYLLVVSFRFLRLDWGIKISLRPALLATFAAFLAILSLQAYFNKINFGSWTRLSNELSNYQETVKSGTSPSPDSSQAVARISSQKGLFTFFYEDNVPFGFYTLTVSGDRGLFFFSPILLLAFLGMYKLGKKMNLETKVLLALVAVNVLLYSSWGDPWGGWAFGPRYLIPSMAVLSLFVGAWVYQSRLWGKISTAALFAYSSAVALMGALVTNAVPPKIEAVKLPLHYYNFLYDIYLFKQNKSGSFLYNFFFFRSLNLKEYYMLIYAVLIFIAFMVLFVGIRKENKEN
ncbi:MAG: hypothetical protein M1333_00330, partial [Patescibacteria group bacterium]|nr:hypothetical protein [Patescibacteria group bacterium]